MVDSAVNKIVRIGRVSSVSESNRTVRVIFADKFNLISAPLIVVENGSEWIPEVGRLVLCIYLPNGDSDGFVIGAI
jgi:hypothetical protein